MQIIILGMHRSGTSALARTLQLMGAQFGPDSLNTGANEENPLGFWERRDVRNLNDQLLAATRSDWDTPDNFKLEAIPQEAKSDYLFGLGKIIKEMDKNQPWMIKEPRNCLTYPLIDSLLNNPICILIYRHPIEVARSLQARNHIPISTGLGLWERYNIDALNASRHRPRILVNYNELMADPTATISTLLHQLRDLGVSGLHLPQGEPVQRELYRQRDYDKRYHQFLNKEQSQLYSQLSNQTVLSLNEPLTLSDGGRWSLREFYNNHQLSIGKTKIVKEMKKEQDKLKRKIERDRVSNRNRLNELEIERKRLNSRIASKQRDITRLEKLVEQLLIDTKAIFNSSRWQLGNWFFSLPYRLLRQVQPDMAPDNVYRTEKRYKFWKNQQQLVANTPSNISPDDAPKPYTPLEEAELKLRIKQYTDNKKPRKIAVYTAISDNYDILKTPEYLDSRFDYICFSDTAIASHPVWQFRPTLYHNVDATRIARYYKLHPHLYLKDYDIAIWIDANILIRNDFSKLLDRFIEGENPLGIFAHYNRDCTYEEAIECIDASKDDREIIFNQVNEYRNLGMPPAMGLPETNMVFSRPSDSRAKKIFTTWWQQLDNGSKRDQISVMYAHWKHGYSFTPLNDSKTEMARFDRDTFELFLHKDKKSYSHPSRYQVPSFLLPTYQNASTNYIEHLESYDSRPQSNFHEITLDIVIPVHNALEDVQACLESVTRHLSSNQRILLIDDGSDRKTKDYLETFQNKNSSTTRLKRNEIAQGYTKAANIGMKTSDADYIILLNSDTIVSRGWAEKMVHCARSSPAIGIVGPLSNAASWQSIPEIKDKDGSYSTNPLPTGVNIETVNHWCEKFSKNEFPRVQVVNGFCFLITRKVIDEIGYFDEISYPKGYNEENDYCFRCTDHGFELSIATNTYVFHAKSKSYTPTKRLKLCEESRVVFEARYGNHRINRATESLKTNPLVNQVRYHIRREWNDV